MRAILALLLLTVSGLAADITLAWDANPAAEQVTKYNVYEILPTGKKLLGSTSGTELKLSLEPGQKTLAVSAVNAWGESPLSDPLVLPNIALKPQRLRVTLEVSAP